MVNSSSPLLAVTYASSHDAPPVVGAELSWADLAKAMSGPSPTPCTRADCVGSECEHKKSSAMWAPIRWREDATRKTRTNVAGVSALGVDVDHVPDDPTLGAIYGRVAEWRHFVHATHSDRPGDRCIRIVLAVSREMTVREADRVRAVAVEMLALPADKKARDASRLYYAPTRPSDACGDDVDGTGYLYSCADGKTLDVDAILALAGPDSEVEFGQREFVVPDFDDAPSEEVLRAAAKALGEAWPDSGRHSAQLALAGGLARAGWPVDLIAQFCALVAEADEKGNADLTKRFAAARSSVEKVRSGAHVEGWPSLIEYVGEDAVSAARLALGLVDAALHEDPALAASLKDAAARASTHAFTGTSPTTTPAPVAVETPPVVAPLSLEVDVALKSAQKILASRKDAGSLRDAEYLRRLARGEALADGNENRGVALAHAALAVVRAVPIATDEQVMRVLMPCAGAFAEHLPDCVQRARQAATQLPSILSRPRVSEDAPLDEFVLERTGPRQGLPAAANKHNFDVALARLGVLLRWDRFARRKMFSLAGSPLEIVQDEHVTDLMFRCEQEFSFYPPKDKFYDYCNVLAHRNAFHPVLDYLDALPAWDGVARVEEWLIRYAGVEDTEYVRAISRLVIVAAVRRVRQPGCKFDEMLILEGEQGTLKSSALQALCPNRAWFTDDFKLGLDTQKQMERTNGKWFVEVGELKGMTLGDLNDLKANLSRGVDEARMAYGREVAVVPRQYVSIGTTNEAQYLRDPTGDRRYWPVTISRPFDLNALLADRDQIWAEAVYLELSHPEADYIRLSPHLYGAAAKEQEKRRVVDPVQVVLEDALDGVVGRIRSQDVWKLLGHEDRLPSSQESRQIAAAMRSLGFKNERHMVGGLKGTYFVRGTGSDREFTLTVVSSGTGHGFRVKPSGGPPPPGGFKAPVQVN